MLIVWYGAIGTVAVLSLMPGELLANAAPDDVLTHFVCYALLAAIPTWRLTSLFHGVLASIAMILLGFLLELLQTVIPGRGFEWKDVASSAMGVALGLTTGLLLRWLFTRAGQFNSQEFH